MLRKEQKKEIINQLSKDLDASKTVVFCDLKGLTVAKLREVRSELREKNAKIKVARKTLIDLALEKIGAQAQARKIEGQIALVYGGEDEITAPKIVANFSKKNENLKIVAGMLEKKAIDAQEVKNLANLPSKDQLIAQVVATINAPISGFANVLAGNIRNLVGVLSSIKDAKN